ncbi:MAG: hypothetical protein HMLIMOIP_002338 [Candidatus Nitrosomirales archaeon]|jgi:hypothetical protein
MEGEKEYLETDVRKILLEHLKDLGIDAELVDSGKSSIEKQPFFSFYFSGTPRMVDSMGCIKVQGKNFDYIHIIRRG